MVLDKSNAIAQYSGATFLADVGILVRIDRRHAITHDKYIVIDGSTVETGSFNYTAAAERASAENVLVIRRNSNLAAEYLANWKVHWAESEPFAPSY